MKALIIEDDKDTQAFLRERLEEKSFAVDTADNGKQGIDLGTNNDYDLVLLDYTLPKKDGFAVCKELRTQDHPTRSHTPIIMISVTKETQNKVAGLNLGVDDYVTKPFFFDELYARIQAIMRRPILRQSNVLQLGDLTLDSNTQKVTRGNQAVYLTRKEFSLLEYLLKNTGTVVSRGMITEHVWDMSIDPFSNTIEMHILNLRKKLDRSKKKKLIHSLPGRGYKIDLVK